jgi:hypothetical protein
VGYSVWTAAEKPELSDAFDELTGEIWPEYNRHGDVLRPNWERLWEVAIDFQLVLVDDDSGEAVAQIHSIPCLWNGTVDGLPPGIDDVLVDGLRLAEERGDANALSALAIEIAPAHQGGGLSRIAVETLVSLARSHGLADVVVPLRPTWKERYPLTPIERYVTWRREDGLPFDPWLRVHVRLGADVLAPSPRSLRITGTVAEWEEWTGIAFPESGTYVFPHGLAPVAIDREADLGSYWEPNVWLRHRANG